LLLLIPLEPRKALPVQPESIVPAQKDPEIRQRRFAIPPDGAEHLLRVVVHATETEVVVVTLYLTSKLSKYEVSP
jgi:hypothetical protein